MKIDILGVKIDRVSLTEALTIAEKWIWNPGKHYIVTPNLEFILAAQKDREFKEILNKADLGLPDSSRLSLSYWLLNKNRFERLLLWPLFFFPVSAVMQFDVVTGIDFMEALCKLSAEKGFTTGFLGGKDEVAQKTAECLKKKYPKLKMVFAGSGGEIDSEGQSSGSFGHKAPLARPDRSLRVGFVPENNSDIRSVVHETAPVALVDSNFAIPPVDLLFVAFGHVKQEKWIAKNLEKIPAHVAMGVGGAFDYISGSVPRAPEWIRNLGFEWLFRLIIQPWRITRQLALFKYLWLLLRYDHH